jgi:hypothetical protein
MFGARTRAGGIDGAESDAIARRLSSPKLVSARGENGKHDCVARMTRLLENRFFGLE